MDDISFKQHYDRIKHQMENEKLMTFEEMVHLTKISPEVLKKTIHVLARRLCLYKKIKGEAAVDDDEEDYWTLQDLQDILDEEEQSQKEKDKYKEVEDKKHQSKADKENYDKEDQIDYGLVDSSSDESHNFDQDEGILSFEDLVRLTGSHPFYLERCLCHLAIKDETE